LAKVLLLIGIPLFLPYFHLPIVNIVANALQYIYSSTIYIYCKCSGYGADESGGSADSEANSSGVGDSIDIESGCRGANGGTFADVESDVLLMI
jgi:hypothetical protein